MKQVHWMVSEKVSQVKHEEREMARGREEERERKAKRKREGGIINRQGGEKGIVDTVLREMFKNKAWRPGQSLYVHLMKA